MRKQSLIPLAVLFMLTAPSLGWLDDGYVASGGSGTVAQYFTDPIFFTKVPQSQPLGFYSPYMAGANYYPFYAVQSEFRNRSLADMQWEPITKNWTATMNYATTGSSFRVYEGGSWRNL